MLDWFDSNSEAGSFPAMTTVLRSAAEARRYFKEEKWTKRTRGAIEHTQWMHQHNFNLVTSTRRLGSQQSTLELSVDRD